ncbi:hypothetical protein [Roseofilum capinflatum]|uniref:Uncharacterized protein n=1 Tax=Roseofilum capinflatum BLCC-M114 TaxID=3022440 RepID=A0ABT7BAD7_9CYAN|nr:hypothetical protein [Roseofilum capinflatum]MDJ1176143.1 hypothetical protein [Roseofilum capinflatum BLCC-M114]
MDSTATQDLSTWMQTCWVTYRFSDAEDMGKRVPELPGLYALVAESQDGENWILLHVGHTPENLQDAWQYYRQLPMVKILHQLSLNVSLALFPLPSCPLPGLSVDQLPEWEQLLIEQLEPMLTQTPAALQIAVK